MKQSIIEKIRNDELAYESALMNIAERICGDYQIKMVLIAGGSCAGKTTTTIKLSELIDALGRKAYTVSLDDYYRNVEESAYLPDGTRDIESINSLRLDLIHESMEKLLSGEEASIPVFDFKTAVRTDDSKRITLKDGDVVLVEGLHALSPFLFAKQPDQSAVYRVYLYADAGDGTDCRFVRRMVRDSRHRNSNATETYALWDNVKKNESTSIEPFRKYADVTINTFFDYERSILNDDAVDLLVTVKEDNPHYDSAKELIDILDSIEPLGDEYVPENSLLWEFM